MNYVLINLILGLVNLIMFLDSKHIFNLVAAVVCLVASVIRLATIWRPGGEE